MVFVRMSLIFCLLAFGNYLKAQQKLLVEEFFDHNSIGWRVDSTPVFRAEIKDGYYQLKVNEDVSSWGTFFRTFYIDHSGNYQISAKIQVNSRGKGLGIMWGAQSSKNYYGFTFHPEGVLIKKVQNGRSVIIGRKRLDIKEDNIEMMVRKQGDRVICLLNGSEVLQTPIGTMPGKGIGFLVSRGADVQIDELIVRHDSEIDLIVNLPSGIGRKGLGPNVNSEMNEYAPVISPDGQLLFFVVPEKGYENIWYSERGETGWGPRMRMPWPLNLPSRNNSVISVSSDNNSLVVIKTYNEDGTYKGKGLSISRRMEEGWGIPEEIMIDDYYNLARRVDQYISANGKVMLHSLERRDGYGQRDLYISFLKEDGSWTRPENLGKDINTGGDEITPCLAPDGVTLYFSNEGRPGYGKTDVFVAKRLDETWKSWSAPKNLGPEMNSRGYDDFYVVPASGEFGYISSLSNSGQDRDLYELTLPEAAKPEPVALVYGTVRNIETDEPIQTKIAFYELEGQTEAGIANSAPGTGEYKVILPGGLQYSLLATKNGFLSISDYVDVRIQNTYEEIRKDLYLTPIKTGATIRLNNLFFDFAESTLRPESFPELDQVVFVMKNNPGMEIKLTGHTDNVGSQADNQSLSRERAAETKKYLVEKGIAENRIQVDGKGEEVPVADNKTEEGRQLNRRVELEVTRE